MSQGPGNVLSLHVGHIVTRDNRKGALVVHRDPWLYGDCVVTARGEGELDKNKQSSIHWQGCPLSPRILETSVFSLVSDCLFPVA